ncbi:MAG: hypothetical protein MUE95_04580, partial [Cyclobacteriaceae bacterium]|nr:hypothetical protein [Cyclobacteriaceae bacterium]
NLTQSAVFIATTVLEHRRNLHSIPGKSFQRTLNIVEKRLKWHVNLLTDTDVVHPVNGAELDKNQQEFLLIIERELDKTVTLVQQSKVNIRMAQLEIRILMELKDIVNEIHTLYKLQLQFSRPRG